MEAPKKARNIIWTSFFEFARVGCAYLLQIIIARRFGMSATLDSYFAAYAIVYFIYRIIGIVVVPILIPLLSKGEKEETSIDAHRLLSGIANTFLILIFLICVLGTIFATDIMSVAAPGFSEKAKLLSTALLRIFIWVAFLGGVLTFTSSLLRYYNCFIQDTASALVQYAVIIPLLLLAESWGIYALAIGLLFAFVAQVLLQIIFLFPKPFRYCFSFRVPKDKWLEMVKLALPLLVTGLLLNSIMIVDNYFASLLPSGAISSLNYAYKLLLLVMVASSIVSTVYFTPISKLAAKGDDEGVRDNFIRAFRITAFIAIPGVIAFSFFGQKILQLLLQSGKFSGNDASTVAKIIVLYAGAGAVWSVWGVCLRLFYAYQRTGLPLICFVVAAVFNALFNWLLMREMGVYGLALASTIAYIAGFIVMIILIVRYYGKEMFAGIPKLCIKLFVTALISCFFGYILIDWYEVMYGFHTKWILLPVMTVAGGIVFFIFAEIARFVCIPELHEFFERYLSFKCFRRYLRLTE